MERLNFDPTVRAYYNFPSVLYWHDQAEVRTAPATRASRTQPACAARVAMLADAEMAC
jgi:hypothetical protein